MNKKALLSFSAIACAFTLSQGALAQDDDNDGLYFRLGAGVNFMNDLEQDITQDPPVNFIVPPPTEQTIFTGAGVAAAAAVGFGHANGIRTELEYRYASAPINGLTNNNPIFQPIIIPDTSVAGHFVMANGYYDFDTGGAVTPFLGVGIGGGTVSDGFGQSDGVLAYQGRGGLSLAVFDDVKLSAEYVHLRTNNLVFGPTAPSLDVFTGKLQTHSVMVTVRKKF